MKKSLFAALFTSVVFVGCNDPQSPGVEYMPDMYRSSAIETYVDYNYPDSATNRMPPDESIPRGYRPFTYENTAEGLEKASKELTYSINLTEKKITEGKALYASFCAHCHGPNGKGEGTIQNPIYGSVPSYLDETPNRRGDVSMKDMSEGHIYHALMYGLNAMGPHSSLIEEEDRWKIIAYIQTLQGKNPIKAQKAAEKSKAVNDSLK